MIVDMNLQDSDEQMRDICKSLKNLINIPRGSIPLARGMGLGWENLSEVPEDMESEYTVDAVQQFAKYEPRVSLREIEFDHETNGTSHAHLIFEGGEADE